MKVYRDFKKTQRLDLILPLKRKLIRDTMKTLIECTTFKDTENFSYQFGYSHLFTVAECCERKCDMSSKCRERRLTMNISLRYLEDFRSLRQNLTSTALPMTATVFRRERWRPLQRRLNFNSCSRCVQPDNNLRSDVQS